MSPQTVLRKLNSTKFLMKRLYLDSHTTTPLAEKALQKMLPFLSERWGSPAAPHAWGQDVSGELDKALQSLYRLFGAKEDDTILVTSSGAEAVNHVVNAVYFDVAREEGKNHFITSSLDEAPVIMSMKRLESLGCSLAMVEPNKKGIISAEAIEKAITPRTALVSLSWVNALTGVINPIDEIGALCRKKGILFHVEATHALGRLFFKLPDLKVDFMSFNGDHLHGPKGTGALYIRQGLKLTPLIVGGGEQGGQRGGSFNVAGMIGLAAAADELVDNIDWMCAEVARLRSKFEKGLCENIPEAVVFFHDVERVTSCTAIAFPGVSNEALLHALSSQGVFASFGGGQFQQIALILGSCAVPAALGQTALCFSFSRLITEEEIDDAVEKISATVKRLQKLSVAFQPFINGAK